MFISIFYAASEFAKLHMGLVVLLKKMSVLINFLYQYQSAQILLVMSDRTDKFCELCDTKIILNKNIVKQRSTVNL
jgi:hypothetical protein